jgi:hypothetical protein
LQEDDKPPADIAEAAGTIRANEYSRHYRMLAMIDDIERAIGRTVRLVRSEAIVLISRYDATQWYQATTVDVWKYLENDMKKRGRAYVRCVQHEYNRILVFVPPGGYMEGLIAQLLFTAKPMPGPFVNTKTKISPKSTALQVWNSPKGWVFSFNNGEGEKLFDDWKKFVTTDKASRIRLGLKGEVDHA